MTLESKIRELVPSLQELSMGCRVSAPFNGKMYWHRLVHKDIDYRYRSPTHGKDVVFIVREGFNTTKKLLLSQIRVSGHPIQLHHIHQAIHKASPGMSYILDAKGNFYAYNVLSEVPKKLNAQWDLTKDLSGQSEETKAFLAEILL